MNKYDIDNLKGSTIAMSAFKSGTINLNLGMVPGLLHSSTIGAVPLKTQRHYAQSMLGVNDPA